MPSVTERAVVSGDNPSPYQLNDGQTLKASTALLQHLRAEAKRLEEASTKKSLLGNEDGDSNGEESSTVDSSIWLNLTTKKHIVDKNRLKPGKIPVPHSINRSPSLSICLITTDPQRAVKDAVSHANFPKSLSSKIGRIIGYSKLKKKYHSFESRRQLLAEHDVFLADDRIVTKLVETLGKTFYKDSAKRPIPIGIARVEKVAGKRVKQPKRDENPLSKKPHQATVADPPIVAKEIESTLHAVPISLRPGTTAAVRVGRASFSPQQLSENIATVAAAMIDRYVARGWRNVKAIHIKSPNSAALPIWLSDDLWVADEDVMKDEEAIEKKKKQDADKAERKANKKKRKAERNENKAQPEGRGQDEQEEQEEQEEQAEQADEQPPLPPQKKIKTNKDKTKNKKEQKANERDNATNNDSKTPDDNKDEALEAARKAKLAKQKARALKSAT